MRFPCFKSAQRGFTLIELLVVIAITGAVSGVIAQTVMMMMDVVSDNRAHMDAVLAVENVERWIERDVKMAQHVELEQQPGTTGTLTLHWATWGGTRSQVQYFIEGSEFRREEHIIGSNGVVIGPIGTLIADMVVSGSPDTVFTIEEDITKRQSVSLFITVENPYSIRGVNRETRYFIVDPRAMW